MNNQHTLMSLSEQQKLISLVQEQNVEIDALNGENQSLTDQLEVKTIESLEKDKTITAQVEIIAKQDKTIAEKDKTILEQGEIIAEQNKCMEKLELKNQRLQEDKDYLSTKVKNLYTETETQEQSLKKKIRKLNWNYKKLIIKDIIIAFILCYSFMVTIIVGIQSSRVMSDIFGAGKGLVNIFIKWLDITMFATTSAANVGNLIEQPTVSGIVSWSVGILVVNLCVALPLLGVYFAGRKEIHAFSQYCKDEYTVITAFAMLITFVWFAECFPFNMIPVLFVISLLYVPVRWFIDKVKPRKMYWG